jgi:hypothetical protein
MGNARWNPDDWNTYVHHNAHRPRAALYSATRLNPAYDPAKIAHRESVDSDANPASTPIIVALDVTGSMGMLPDKLIRGPLGTFVEQIIDRRPVTDPHLMFMAIGDADHDEAPLQVTQFEADVGIANQLRELWLEGRGGGNNSESYHLPWLFAALKTVTDSNRKRGRKGYLFTVGDEQVPPALRADQVSALLGLPWERDVTAAEALLMAQQDYHVFHVVVEEGQHCRAHRKAVFSGWQELLGEHVLPLSDHTRLAEVLVSAIAAHAGTASTDIVSSWSGPARDVVARALAHWKPVGTADGGLVVL